MSDIGFDRLQDAIDRAASASLDELTNRMWVAGWVARAGLFTDERDLYGAWQSYALPRNTNGTWQHPEELADLFVHLSRRPPSQFVEVGCFRGWTTALAGAYFRRFDPDHRAIGIDVAKYWSVPDGIPCPDNAVYFHAERQHWIPERNRFVLIDADHSYLSARTDLVVYGKHAAAVAFHDIYDATVRDTPGYDGGVWRLWREVRKANESLCTEFRRSDGVEAFGIGLVEAPTEDAP